MRIGLITTFNSNFGDDLIREGICLILREVFKQDEIAFIPINKFDPLMVYPDWHPIPLIHSATQLLPRGRNRTQRWAQKLVYRVGFSRLDDCDLIVQCGTPVIWPGCSRCGWAEPLWRQVVGRLNRKGMDVLNLGAGSCYPWEAGLRPPLDESDADYMKEIFGYCRITTARDTLAQHLFESLGCRAPLIPCPAMLAGRPFIKRHTDGEFIVINYMEKGGHFEWGQGINSGAWREVVKIVTQTIRKKHRVLFLCHNQKEYELAVEIAPDVPRFLPTNPREYFSVLAEATIGICNRIHAVIALAGLGVPSVAIGTDTRLLAVEALNLPYVYVKEATVEKLEDALQNLVTSRQQERERLLTLQEQTWAQYIDVVENASRCPTFS